ALRRTGATVAPRASAHGTAWRARRSRSAEGAEPPVRNATAVDSRRRVQGGRLRSQSRIAQAAPARAVREAATTGAAQDADGPTLDGGGRARRARRVLRVATPHPRLPHDREAEVDLHRQAPRAD